MADFVGLDKDTASIAEKCAGMNDRSDAAGFIVMQQDMIQESVIAARRENKAKAGADAGNAQGTGAASKAMSAYERMKALKKN